VKVDAPTAVGKRVVLHHDDDENTPVRPTPKMHQQTDDMDDWLSDDGSDARNDDDLSPEEQQKRHIQNKRRRKLDALKDRENDLTIALSEVETQRARMNGTIGGSNKKGVKFKVRSRKR
jgi:U3 small nucleolar RNA-associated protein 11